MSPFLNPTFILSIVVALSVHEWAHAMAATKLGDPTPHNEGRLTLNPIAHIDPIGALLFLTAGFGWAKPVPVNPAYFHKPKQGMLITALAGPLSNLILAFIAFFTILFLTEGAIGGSVWELIGGGTRGMSVQTFILQFLQNSLFVNLGLMAFNLIPIAPLDGSNIVQALIPLRYEDAYFEFNRRGPYVLLFLLLGERLLGFAFLSTWIGGVMDGVLAVMQGIAGLFL
jgi:Zn-dependent protease